MALTDAAELTHPVPEGWMPKNYVVFLRAGADLHELKAARESIRKRKQNHQQSAKRLREQADAIAAGLKETGDGADR